MGTPHTWIASLLTALPEEKIAARVSDSNADWEYVDGEMVKLGALGHNSLDINQVQQRILLLLASESKDFRLIGHLLRTLQHAGRPLELILSAQLLCAWVKAYWSSAWPESAVIKRRLAQQILKRFASAADSFIEKADHGQVQEMLGELAHLAHLWQQPEADLAREVDALCAKYRRQPEKKVEETPQPGVYATASGEPVAPVAAPIPTVDVESSDEKSWRHTQLKVAEVLCERQPENPLGYRLRRNAIWSGITTLPQSQEDGRTPLAAFSADRMAEYLVGLNNPDLSLWRRIEQSLSLAPYWFEGHWLSASVAMQLGFPRVAEAIHEELGYFLQRLPALKTLSFTDRTPFLPGKTREWAEPVRQEDNRAAQADSDKEAIWQCWQQQGLEAALVEIDRLQQRQDPRGQFYSQLLSANLLDEAGLTSLAQQSYSQLAQTARTITLPDWEPSLIAQLKEKQSPKG